MQAMARYTRNRNYEPTEVEGSASVSPGPNGGHAVAVAFRFPRQSASDAMAFLAHMSPDEARELAGELTQAAEHLSPRAPIFTPTSPDVLLAAELTAIPGKDYGPLGWRPPAGYNRCRNSATISHAFLDDGAGNCRKCGAAF